MNCKPGDLAIMIRSSTGVNLGKVVQCLRLSQWDGLTRPDGSINHGPVWEVDSELVAWNGVKHNLALDSSLRPIRDSGGEDESFRWAPAPEKVTV